MFTLGTIQLYRTIKYAFHIKAIQYNELYYILAQFNLFKNFLSFISRLAVSSIIIAILLKKIFNDRKFILGIAE